MGRTRAKRAPEPERAEVPGSRQRLVDAASRLFRLKGYRAVGLEDILDLARVTRSNFYYHFAGKAELGLAVIDIWARAFEREMIGPFLENQALPPGQRLRRFFQALRRQLARNHLRGGCPFGTIATELSDEVEAVRGRLSRFFRRLEEAMRGVLREGVAQGGFRADLRPEAAATQIVSTMEGMILLARTHRSLEPFRRGLPHLLESLAAPERKGGR